MFETAPTNSAKENPEQESNQERAEDYYDPEFERQTAETGLTMVGKIQAVQERIDSLLESAQAEKERLLRQLKKKAGILKGAGMAALLAVAVGANQEVSAQDLQSRMPPSGSNTEQTNEANQKQTAAEEGTEGSSQLTKYHRHLMNRFTESLDNEERQVLNATQRLNMNFDQQLSNGAQETSQQQDTGFDISPGFSSFEVSFEKDFSSNAALDDVRIGMEVEGSLLNDGGISPKVDAPKLKITANL